MVISSDQGKIWADGGVGTKPTLSTKMGQAGRSESLGARAKQWIALAKHKRMT